MSHPQATTRVVDRKVYFSGDKVFKEGDQGDRAYVVERGLIEIFKIINEQEVVLGTVSKGGIFGEMALIDDKPRMASARAVQQTTLVIVPRDMFRTKIAKADPFIRGLLNIFVKNLRRMAEDAARREAGG